MKILMVAGHFNLPIDKIPIGGVQRHISFITKEFQNRKYEIEWCYPSEAKKELKIFNPDIVISHDFFCFVENCPVPQITVFHGYEGNIPPLESIIKVRQDIEKKASATICVGEYLRKWYRQNPDKVIWGGVNEVSVTNSSGNKEILYLGRLDPDQAPEIAFEAFGQMKEKCHITVCASGRLEKEIRNIVDKYKLNVTFNGFVSNPDEYIKKADVVVCSGYLTILESYINKRPTISTYNNALKEDYLHLMPTRLLKLSNSTYQFTCFNDSQKMASHLDYIIVNGYFPEIIESNYQFAIQNTWSKVADVYEELFKKCLQK